MTRPRPSDVPTAVRAALWVVAARWVLGRSGFEGAVRRYSLQPAPNDATITPLPASVRRSARVAGRVVRNPLLRATCLPRAIAIARVVARTGADPRIVLGVSKREGFSAHAWVEVGGERFDPAGHSPDAYKTAGRFVFER